jgi:hypothetical protein
MARGQTCAVEEDSCRIRRVLDCTGDQRPFFRSKRNSSESETHKNENQEKYRSCTKKMSASLEQKLISAIVEYNRVNHAVETNVESLSALLRSLLPGRKSKVTSAIPRDPHAPSPLLEMKKEYASDKIGVQWRKLSASEKSAYEAVYKQKMDEYKAVLEEYTASERCELWKAYHARLLSNKALLGIGPVIPDSNAPVKRRSAFDFFLEKAKANTKYFNKSKWVTGAKDKLKAKCCKLSDEQYDEYEKAEQADDLRYMREYSQYIPSAEYLALVASKRAPDAPVKPKNVNVTFVDEYIAKNGNGNEDKDALKALKALAKSAYAKLSKEDKASLSAQRAVEMQKWALACEAYASAHPAWVSPVSPKAVKKGKAKKAVVVESESESDEDVEVVADEVANDSEESD